MKKNYVSQRITDAAGSVIGYLRGGMLYDTFDTPLFRLCKTKDADIRYVNHDADGRLFGTLDMKTGCLYDADHNYIGSVAQKQRQSPVRLTVLLLFGTLCSFYLLLGILKPTSVEVEDTPLTLICIPQAEGELDWSQNSTLNIFSQSAVTRADGTTEEYVVKNKIAPNDTGVYGFVLNNENDRTIAYQISLAARNDYHMPILYKLKMGGEYIAGSETQWFDIQDFSADDLKLTRYSSVQFELHWKWDGSNDALDTKIGSESLAYYMLTITLRAGYA